MTICTWSAFSFCRSSMIWVYGICHHAILNRFMNSLVTDDLNAIFRDPIYHWHLGTPAHGIAQDKVWITNYGLKASSDTSRNHHLPLTYFGQAHLNVPVKKQKPSFIEKRCGSKLGFVWQIVFKILINEIKDSKKYKMPSHIRRYTIFIRVDLYPRYRFK